MNLELLASIAFLAVQMGSYHESYQKVSVARGHRIYKVVWTPEVGEVLKVRTEDGNEHAIAVVKDGLIIGHVPRSMSHVCWFFLMRNELPYHKPQKVRQWFGSTMYLYLLFYLY